MAKLIGANKINTSVFISGKGTNLKNLIKFSKTNNSPIKINIVISNNKRAYGIRYAKKNKIKIKIIDFSKKREINHLLKILKLNNIRLICLAGFLKILSKDFIKSFNGKIINIHPSLLPKYKGLNTHERVLENNEKFTYFIQIILINYNTKTYSTIKSLNHLFIRNIKFFYPTKNFQCFYFI